MKVGVWMAIGAGSDSGAVVRWVCLDGWNGWCCGGGGDESACWRLTASVSVGAVVYGMMWPAFSSWMRGSALS